MSNYEGETKSNQSIIMIKSQKWLLLYILVTIKVNQ